MFTRVSYPSIARGTITMNDNPNVSLTGVSGLSNPRIRRESDDMPMADFGVYYNSQYGERAFTLQGILTASSLADLELLRDKFSSAFSIFEGERPLTFEYADQPARAINCVASDEVRFDPDTDSPYAVQFAVPMVASFPFLQAATATTITLSMTTPGGFAVPAKVPLGLTAGRGGAFFVINDGTAPAYLTARFKGYANNPAIRNLNTGEDITLATTINSGEWIDADFRLTQLRDQGGRNRYDAFRGTFFKLPVGSTQLALVANSYSAETQATITYAPTYLSL